MPKLTYLFCSLTLASEVQREAAAREADAVATVVRVVVTGMIVVISRVIIGVATVLLVIARVIVVMTTVMTTVITTIMAAVMAAVVRTTTSVPIRSRGRRGHDSEQTQDDEAKCKAFHFRSLSVLGPSGPMPLCCGLKSKDQ